MRLFVALWPPTPALRELSRAERRLYEEPTAERLRWAGDGGHHLTLVFLGEVAEDVLPDLRARLERATHRHQPMSLRLAGGGRFGDRTLWVGVAGDTTELGRLVDSLAAAARRSGIAVEEGRAFRPHLTLARSRPHRHTALRPYVDLLADFTGQDWTADHIDLVRSHLPEPGAPGTQPRYETLNQWRLGR